MPSITNKQGNTNESQVETNGLMTPSSEEAVEQPELTHWGWECKDGTAKL